MLCKILLYVRNILLDLIIYFFSYHCLHYNYSQCYMVGQEALFFGNLYDNIIGTIWNGSNITEYK